MGVGFLGNCKRVTLHKRVCDKFVSPRRRGDLLKFENSILDGNDVRILEKNYSIDWPRMFVVKVKKLIFTSLIMHVSFPLS